MALPLPEIFSVELAVKIGEPRTNTRKTVGALRSMNLVLAEGYVVFREKIKAAIAQEKEIQWPADGPIMVKPTLNATQQVYEELAANTTTLLQQLTRIWSLSSRRKAGYCTAFLYSFYY